MILERWSGGTRVVQNTTAVKHERLVVARSLAVLVALLSAAIEAQAPEPPIDAFLEAAAYDRARAEAAHETIAAGWRNGHAAMLVDLLDIVERVSDFTPGTFASPRRLARFLESQTGQRLGTDLDAWRQWVWSLPYEPHPDYAEFKARLYALLDQRFTAFFRSPLSTAIRLDEIQWGGVPVNGIPALDHPAHLPADRADYLDDADVVFGLRVGGEARAYPKRILAWHELARDSIGERELAIVYCTLCGAVIPYDAVVDGRRLDFATSGLLYRSNKLMFEVATGSLWSSLTGEPVVGPLVGSGLKLSALPVVTTTWGDWRRRHPETTVLSLDTGFERDYSEGAAYRAYFGTDELMFDVALKDGRLPNKAEVLVIREVPGSATQADATPPVAISTAALRERAVLHLTVAGNNLVVVSSPDGANRVYASGGHRFVGATGHDTVRDELGAEWRAGEEVLESVADAGVRLPRVAAHRAFWFGWYAQHPDTELIE
jgi:hypothetical protein